MTHAALTSSSLPSEPITQMTALRVRSKDTVACVVMCQDILRDEQIAVVAFCVIDIFVRIYCSNCFPEELTLQHDGQNVMVEYKETKQ